MPLVPLPRVLLLLDVRLFLVAFRRAGLASVEVGNLMMERRRMSRKVEGLLLVLRPAGT
jgi:hypothetical protein